MFSWVNFCRCCLSSNCELSLLYGEENVYEKFFETTTIQVKKDDGLPQKLCNVCYNVMISAHQFREQCIRIDTELKHLINDLIINKPHFVEESIDDNTVNRSVMQLKAIEEKNTRPEDNYLLLANNDEYVVLLIDNLKNNNNTLTQINSNGNIFHVESKDNEYLNSQSYVPAGVLPLVLNKIEENPAKLHQENAILQQEKLSIEQSKTIEKKKATELDDILNSFLNNSENKFEEIDVEKASSQINNGEFVHAFVNSNNAMVTNLPAVKLDKEEDSPAEVQYEIIKEQENTFLKELKCIEKKESTHIDKNVASVIYNLIDELEHVLVEDKILEAKVKDSIDTCVNYDNILPENEPVFIQGNGEQSLTNVQHENAFILFQENSFINQFETIDTKESMVTNDYFVTPINDLKSKSEQVKLGINICETDIGDTIDVLVNSINTLPNVPTVKQVYEEESLAKVQQKNTSFKQIDAIDKKEPVETDESLISLLFDLNYNTEQLQVESKSFDKASETKVEVSIDASTKTYNTLPYDISALITNEEKGPNNLQEQILQRNIKTTSINGNNEWSKENMNNYYNKHSLTEKLLCSLCRKPYNSIDMLIGHILCNITINDFFNIHPDSGVDSSDHTHIEKYPHKQLEAIEASKSLEEDEYFVFIIDDSKDKFEEVQNEDKISETEVKDPIDAIVDASVKSNNVQTNVTIVNPDNQEDSMAKVNLESAKILQHESEATHLINIEDQQTDMTDCNENVLCNVKTDFDVDANIDNIANDSVEPFHEHNNKNPTERLLCNICKKTYDSIEILTGHMLLHINPKILITCPLCNKSIRREAITLHIKYSHSKSPKCDICFKIFGNPQQLSRHMLVHRKKEHKCDICSKCFYNKTSMQAHAQTHTYHYLSNDANKTFKSKSALVEHKKFNKCTKPLDKKLNKREMINKLLNHTCPMCNQKFSSLTDVEQHIKNCEYGKVICEQNITDPQANDEHATKMIFKCKLCNKIFPSYAQLLLHKHIHTNERPIPCHLCSVKLKNRADFRTHILKHKKQNKYGCSICMKVFTLKSNLLVHMRVHAFEKV